MNFARPVTDPDFKKTLPQPLHELKKIGPTDPIALPELSKNRKCTDIVCLLLFIVAVTSAIVSSVFIWRSTDLKNVINGEDSCCNICGVNNVPTGKTFQNGDCNPKDLTEYPISLYILHNHTYSEETVTPDKCIKAKDCEDHPNRELIFRRCFPVVEKEEQNYKSIEDVKNNYRKIETLMCKASFVFSAMILFSSGVFILIYHCFRCHAENTLWTLIYAAMCITSVAVSASLYFVFTTASRKASIVAIFNLVFLIIILYVKSRRKRLELVTELYKEATQAIFASPLLLALPLLITCCLIAVTGTGIYMFILAVYDVNFKDGNQLIIRICYVLVLLIVVIWVYGFCNGYQCIIVATSTAFYYFARDKSTRRRPFAASVMITAQYHLGTIAAGSLLVTMTGVIRIFISWTRNTHQTCVIAVLCTYLLCLFTCIEEIAQYICKKSYMMTALHGRGLYPSGVRAMKLLWYFLLDTIMVDSLGYTVMACAAYLCIVASLLFGLTICQFAGPVELELFVIIGLFVSTMVAFLYCSLMNVAVSTLFLCFCEDKLLNDGSDSRPYYMSKRLMNFMTSAWELAGVRAPRV